MSGEWIRDDQKVQRRVIASLAKGISILDRENQFGMTDSMSENVSSASNSKAGEIVKNESNPVGLASPSFTSLRQKKQQSRSSLTPNKRFSKLFDAKQQPLATISGAKAGNAQSNITTLSAETQIKGAAEHALSLICLRLANFPPKNSCFGLTYLGSAWDEIQFSISVYKIREKLRQSEPLDTSESNASMASKFARYFAYQKRLILGIIENPDWSSKEGVPREPSLTLVIRDPEGKYTWSGVCKYVDYMQQDQVNSMETLVELPFFTPYGYMVQKDGTEVVTSISVNESNIPSMSECAELFDNFNLDEETYKLKQLYSIELENCILVQNEKKHNPAAAEKPVDTALFSHIPKRFRSLLASLGFLDYDFHSQLNPLILSDALLRDLATLDSIRE